MRTVPTHPLVGGPPSHSGRCDFISQNLEGPIAVPTDGSFVCPSFVLCGALSASLRKRKYMNRTVFSLPAKSEYLTNGGLAVARVGRAVRGRRQSPRRADRAVGPPPRRRAVLRHDGAGRYESFDLGSPTRPLVLESSGTNFVLQR